jgi:putative addiction module component (TIGR02574 family)
MGKVSLSDVMELSVEERIRLVQDIWDSIAAECESLPFTEEERVEINRRLELHRINPGAGSTWEEVRARLLKEP